MGHVKVSLFSLWKGIYLGNGSEATSINLQETYGGNFPKDPEISFEKLAISTFQCTVQERSRNSTSRCTESSYLLPMEDDGIQLPIIAVNLVMANIPYNSNEFDNICGESGKDPSFKVLMHYIYIGWPCE